MDSAKHKFTMLYVCKTETTYYLQLKFHIQFSQYYLVIHLAEFLNMEKYTFGHDKIFLLGLYDTSQFQYF